MIRRATPADAEPLSALSRTCFTQTFGHLYDPGDLETFLDEAYAPGVLRAELEDPDRPTRPGLLPPPPPTTRTRQNREARPRPRRRPKPRSAT